MTSLTGYSLLHHGARALSRVERAGIRIDVGYLDGAIESTKVLISDLERELSLSSVMLDWRKKFESATKLGSRPQLAWVVENSLGHTLPRTRNNQPKTDDAALSVVDHPFIKAYVRIIKLRKCLSTYLLGIRRETVEGILRPFFNLHTVLTYRSSSDSPNFQNMPVRDPELRSLVRRAFIPRKGRALIEVDYGGIEVKIAACYHQDPTMLSYINDSTRDLHRDMAAQCYLLREDDITKEIRYFSKNSFVFPQFYGATFDSCARNLWDAIQGGIKTKGGVPVMEHLASKGLVELGLNGYGENASRGTFGAHLQKVEKHFWGDRFHVYQEWKDKWFAEYCRRGFLELKTGFVCRSPMARNEAINYAVQGSAFHCLLWSLIRLVLKDIPESGMRAMAVGQVHDSIVADVPLTEVEDYKAMVFDIMVNKLAEAWKWIIVPLEVEFSSYPESWEKEGSL